jgi:hypothetical protein
MEILTGQRVVWTYRASRHKVPVEGEVVQSSLLRMRIRVWNAQGDPMLRWVKPANLRLKQVGEPHYCYPGSP